MDPDEARCIAATQNAPGSCEGGMRKRREDSQVAVTYPLSLRRWKEVGSDQNVNLTPPCKLNFTRAPEAQLPHMIRAVVNFDTRTPAPLFQLSKSAATGHGHDARGNVNSDGVEPVETDPDAGAVAMANCKAKIFVGIEEQPDIVDAEIEHELEKVRQCLSQATMERYEKEFQGCKDGTFSDSDDDLDDLIAGRPCG